MKKKDFENFLCRSINQNFDRFKYYFDYKFQFFHELESTVYQIVNCLILEYHLAAVTLTNNFLERLLKLSLIYKVVGTDPIPIENWNSVFEGPNNNYGSLMLANSIIECRNEGLITESEKEFLFNKIREMMRNGFSHADASKILRDSPDVAVGFMGTLDGKSEMVKVELNQKVIPPLQSAQIESFVGENSSNYFYYVFKLLQNITMRLKNLETRKT